MTDFLKNRNGCSCGRLHNALIDDCVIKHQAIDEIPSYMERYGVEKAFVVSDINTEAAAGKKVKTIIKNAGKKYVEYIFEDEHLKPNEAAVGSAVMHFDRSCDVVIGVGSGVINDICKMLSVTAGLPYFIAATAPSMDGYASATSSMDRDGLKVSIATRCANVIFGDIDVLKNAPQEMLISGIGDMLAKYISICEWRISNLVIGEYYCEEIAKLIREALERCVNNAEGLLKRDEQAVTAVFEGLIIGGVAMNYAGISRPASGVEHYFSHIWDMRGLEFGAPTSTHGIQCAVATIYAAQIYEQIKTIKPNKEKALKYAEDFEYGEYSRFLRKFLGKGAEAMIALEVKEGKYDVDAHKKRIEIICERFDGILQIISQEVPPVEQLKKLYGTLHLADDVEQIGLQNDIIYPTFCATKDIRDKYVLSRLCFDLGIIEELNL